MLDWIELDDDIAINLKNANSIFFKDQKGICRLEIFWLGDDLITEYEVSYRTAGRICNKLNIALPKFLEEKIV